MCFQRGCSKVRQHLSMVSTDRKQAQNHGRAEGTGEGILPSSSRENGEGESKGDQKPKCRSQYQTVNSRTETRGRERTRSAGAKKMIWFHEVENIASRLLFSP